MQYKNNGIIKTTIMLFLCSISLQAADFVDDFPLYLYGDASFFSTVYEFVKSFTSDILVSGSEVQVIIGLGTTLSVLVLGYKAKDGGPIEIAKGVAAPIALVSLFIVPTVKVHIVDLRVDRGIINYSVPDGGYKVVDDVPYALAAIPSISSTIISFFIDSIDNNWSGVNLGAKFSTLGFQGIANVNKQVMVLAKFGKIGDTNLTTANADVANLNEYIKKCLVDKALSISKLNKTILYHPKKPFPDMFDPSIYDGNLTNENVIFYPASGGMTRVKCGYAYTTYVSSKESSIENAMKNLFNQSNPNIDADNADLNTAYKDQIGDTAGLIGNIGKAMATISSTRALEQNLETAGIGVNGSTVATQISIQSTLSTLRTEGPAKYEWITRTLPDAISILLAVMIGVFPIMIIVMSFYGAKAFPLILNYFMGYVAINFNLVGMALVSNIMSYYTAQHAQEAIVGFAGMPFGLTQVDDFMIGQADMAGFAGIIGAAAIFGITPLVFYGESKGISAAVGAVGGMFKGNVVQTAQKELADYDAQMEIDSRARTVDGMNEAEAGAWLSKEGFTKPDSMSAVEAYNNMMKNYQQIGAADTSSILHHGNLDKFNADNYIKGSAGQSMQRAAGTAGFGAGMGIEEGQASMADIASVSIEDGETQAAMVDKTQSLRSHVDGGYDPNAVGAGQAISAHAKNMGSALLNDMDKDANASVANASKGVVDQVSAGRALLKTGAFNSDGTVTTDENGNAVSSNGKMQDYTKGLETQTGEKFEQTAGYGSTVNTNKALEKSHEDGARSGETVNKTSDMMFSDATDENGRRFYDREEASHGEALSSMASLQSSMQTGKSADEKSTHEKNGDMDYVMGAGANARKAANDNIGIGETFGAMTDSQQIAEMAKVKKNASTGFFGGIDATNAEIMEHKGGNDAIKDMVTSAQQKGIISSADASVLRKNYDTDHDGQIDDAKSVVSDAQRQSAKKDKAKAVEEFNKVLNSGGFDMDNVEDKAKFSELQSRMSADDGIISNDAKMTLSEQAVATSQQKLESQLGQSAGIVDNMQSGQVNYAENAMYGEMSQQRSTSKKIETQGGVDGAVHTDVTEAGQKAASQKGAVEGLQSEAESIGEKIGKSAAKVMEDTAKAQAMGKISSDSTEVEKFDSAEQFAENKAKIASAQASKEHGKLLLDKDQANNDNFMHKLIEKTADGNPEKREAAIKRAQEKGLLIPDENGELHAPVGTAFSDAISGLSAGDMGRDKQFQFMGTSFNVDRSSDGQTRFQTTSQETFAKGKKRDSGAQMAVAQFYAKKIAPQGASEDKIDEIAGTLNDSSDFADAMASKKGVFMTAESGAISAAKIYDSVKGTHYAENLTDKLKTATEADNPDGIIGNSLNGNNVAMATVGAEAVYQATKMIPGTSHSGTLTGKVAKGAMSTYNKLTGKTTESIFNESPEKANQSDNPKTDSSVGDEVNNQHNKSSFEGKKYNEAGGNTKAYQSHLDSVAKNAEKVKYAKNAAKIVGKGVVGAVASYAAEESLGWASQSALDQENYRTSNFLSAGENTIKGFGNTVGAGIVGFAGGLMTGVEKTFGVDIGANKVLSMSNEMLDAAGTQGATAMLNVSDMVTGDKTVVGKTRQPLSMAATKSMLDFAPPGGSGQTPGSSGYRNPNYENNLTMPSFGNSFGPAGGSGQTPGSSGYVPPYARNAFSSTTGSNTIGAMNGGYNPSESKNAYNDTTSNVNGTPSEYKADNTQSSMDKQDDIALATEYSYEATQEVSEAVERLTNAMTPEEQTEGEKK